MADLAKKAKGLWEETKKKVKKPSRRGDMGVYSNLATQKKSVKLCLSDLTLPRR